MKTIAICGSKRFKPEIRALSKSLREAGVTVYEPYLYPGVKENTTVSLDDMRFIALGLTHDHMYKIKMADIVYIYNKDGYVGNSTTMEIGAALALEKPIYAYAHDEEICRDVLFREIITTAKGLINLLQ